MKLIKTNQPVCVVKFLLLMLPRPFMLVRCSVSYCFRWIASHFYPKSHAQNVAEAQSFVDIYIYCPLCDISQPWDSPVHIAVMNLCAFVLCMQISKTCAILCYILSHNYSLVPGKSKVARNRRTHESISV